VASAKKSKKSGKKRRKTRPESDYINSAKRLAAFVPSLKKYKRRKRLKPQEKSAIARREKQLHYFTTRLAPLSKKDARIAKRKGEIFSVQEKIKSGKKKGQYRTVYGFSAVDTGTLSYGTKARYDKNKNLILSTPQKDVWEFRSLPGGAFDIADLIALAEEAFADPEMIQFHLWTVKGIAGQRYKTLKRFIFDTSDEGGAWRIAGSDISATNDPSQWIKGIAVLISERGIKK
jgi:hypothetical protein